MAKKLSDQEVSEFFNRIGVSSPPSAEQGRIAAELFEPDLIDKVLKMPAERFLNKSDKDNVLKELSLKK
jgi:hypothetical protein|tara:strand:- start:1899 stop:2105 length:207 start_codon:yes stop_codon:yes gene_type:complete